MILYEINVSKKCLAAVICITLGLIPLSDTAIAGSERGLSGNYSGERITITSSTLKLITLNLAHGRGGSANQILLNESSIRGNLKQIGLVLKPSNYDIIALQEADAPSLWSGGFDHVQYLAAQSGYDYYASARHSSSPLFAFGTAFISKVPLSNVTSKKFKPSPPTLNKGFLAATISWNPNNRLDRPMDIDLASVHLDFSRRKVRMAQAEELIASLSSRQNPLIVLGDLNADWTDTDPTVRTITKSLGLKAYEPQAATLGTYRSSGKRLDWILISRELEFLKYTVLPDVLSDHLAVVAEITAR